MIGPTRHPHFCVEDCALDRSQRLCLSSGGHVLADYMTRKMSTYVTL